MQAEIMKQIEARRQDAEKYIYPQKQYADLVIRYFDKELLTGQSQEDASYQSEPGVEFLMDVSINAEPLLALLQEHGIPSKLTYDDDLLHQRVLLESENLHVQKDVWEAIALGNSTDRIWQEAISSGRWRKRSCY